MSKHSLSEHHRKPRSLGGSSDKRNLIRIKENCHRAWHLLFQAKNPQEIAQLINSIYLDPDWKFEAKMRGS